MSMNEYFQTEKPKSNQNQLEHKHINKTNKLLDRSGFIKQIEYFISNNPQLNHKFCMVTMQLSREQSRGFELDTRSNQNIHEHLAKRLCKVIPNRVICRWNDSVYACMIHITNTFNHFQELLINIQKDTLQPFQFDSNGLRPVLIFGISRLGIDGTNATELVTHAQSVGLVLNKQGLTLNHGTDEAIHLKAKRNKIIELGLARGIELNQLELEFQPILNLKQAHINGVESLVRWNHPKIGKIYPEEFIPAAENTGLIDALGKWVIKHAFESIATLKQKGFELECSINCSTIQIIKPDFLSSIEENKKLYNISPESIEFEITESMSIQHMEQTLLILEKLGNLGFKIALDDFGTGYASLNHLRILPLHTLKIDKSFIQDFNHDLQSQVIVKAIIDLAHALGLSAQAEGIENNNQVESLKKMGCDKIQGYWVAKPMNLEQLIIWLTENRSGSAKLNS